MSEAWIVSAVRTPVGRAYKGSLRATRPDDLAALVIKEALARVPGLDAKEIDDVILGCAMPEGEQGMNVARIAALYKERANHEVLKGMGHWLIGEPGWEKLAVRALAWLKEREL